MLHGHLRPGYDYLLDRKLTVILREAAASPLGPDLKRFLAGAEALGYSVRPRTGMASEVAIRMLIQTGRPLAELTDADFDEFGQAITEREARLGPGPQALPPRPLRLPGGDLPPRRPGRAGAQALHAGPVELGTPLEQGQPAVAADDRLPGTAAGHHAASSVQGAASELGALRPVPGPARDPGLSSLALLGGRRHIEPYLTEVGLDVTLPAQQRQRGQARVVPGRDPTEVRQLGRGALRGAAWVPCSRSR